MNDPEYMRFIIIALIVSGVYATAAIAGWVADRSQRKATGRRG